LSTFAQYKCAFISLAVGTPNADIAVFSSIPFDPVFNGILRKNPEFSCNAIAVIMMENAREIEEVSTAAQLCHGIVVLLRIDAKGLSGVNPAQNMSHDILNMRSLPRNRGHATEPRHLEISQSPRE
jgi:hypothetical protein